MKLRFALAAIIMAVVRIIAWVVDTFFTVFKPGG